MKFINTGLDQRITNSFITESKILTKGIDKSKLVPVETTVNSKNGSFTRKQWKDPNNTDSKKDHISSKDNSDGKGYENSKEEKESSKDISFECKDGNAKVAAVQLLVNGNSRDDIMSAAKNAGINWDKSENTAINWVRCSNVVQNYMKDGVTRRLKERPPQPTHPDIDGMPDREERPEKRRTPKKEETHKEEQISEPNNGDLQDDTIFTAGSEEEYDKQEADKLSSNRLDNLY